MSETQGNSQELSYKERPVIENPEQVLTQSTDKLVKFGGFDLIETTVEGSQNLNPEKKARKKIFLSEADKKKEREQLKKTLEMWYQLLSSTDSISEMVDKAQIKGIP